MQRLYVSDMDGTLLDQESALSPHLLAGLNQALAEGLQFTVASGRSIYSMRRVIGELDLRLPVIECNGAYVTDWQTGEHLAMNPLASDMGAMIYERAVTVGLDPFVLSSDGEQDWLSYGRLENAGTKWYHQQHASKNDPRLRHLSNMTPVFQENVVGFIIMGEQTTLAHLQADVQDTWGKQLVSHLYEAPHFVEWSWLDIHDATANKGNAIQTMQNKLNLPVDELVVFGDQVNDLSMFQVANRAYAPASAVPRVQTQATDMLTHHNQGSVIKFILSEWQNS